MNKTKSKKILTDTKRLDFLQKSCAHVAPLSNGIYNVWIYGKGDYDGETLREAIDNAVKGKLSDR